MSKLTETERAEIEARMKALPDPDLTDPDNPEWTAEDFARAKPVEDLEPDAKAAILANFPNTARRLGGRPKAANPKQQVTLRLAPDILEHFKAGGAGWQVRIEETLRAAVKAGGGR
jgi:uncharacterized protein (DUF4415 family)